MVRKILVIVLIASIVIVAGLISCSKKNPTALTATGTISGVVTDSANGSHIAGAVVTTVPVSNNVTTDTAGRYTIAGVGIGAYVVTAGKANYTNRSASATITTGNTITVNFSLAAVVPLPLEWISISAGNFTMGSTAADTLNWPGAGLRDELPQHAVYLDAYHISKFLVTNAQYKSFIDAGGYTNSAYWTAEGWAWRIGAYGGEITHPYWWTTGEYNSGPGFPNYPVIGVSWYEAYAFCEWAGGHLPTEAQWEKAARGTDARYWPWGSTWDANRCNSVYNISTDTFAYGSPVNYFDLGKSPYGLYDMAGNVSEWCSDWYVWYYYIMSPSTNPTGPDTGTQRVVRGGCYGDNRVFCLSVFRDWDNPGGQGSASGFRVAK